MAGMTITNQLSKLHVLFNDVKNVYYVEKELKAADLGTSLTALMELPILEDGITLNTGEPDVTRIKIINGDNWDTRSKKGDPDITFQVASIAGVVNDLFMEKKVTVEGAANIIIDGATYSGTSYSLAPKKVKGALIMMSEDKSSVIVLPSVEMYASLVAADGDNPAYFNVTVTPLANEEGADVMILNKAG